MKRLACIRVNNIRIPAPILSHYDRMVARGKKGVALVRHQTCSGCHINVPLGVVVVLSHGLDVRLCDNCQRYLYLQKETAESFALAASKTATKTSRKQLAHAV